MFEKLGAFFSLKEFGAPWKAEKKEKSRFVALVVILAITLVVATAIRLQALAELYLDPDNPAWQVAVKAQIILLRLMVGIPMLLAGPTIVSTAFVAWSRTRLARRLTHWNKIDGPESEAAKTAAAGHIFVAFVLAYAALVIAVLF